MTPERIEQERKAFEEWYYDSIGDTRLPLDKYENGCYCNPIAEDMLQHGAPRKATLHNPNG